MRGFRPGFGSFLAAITAAVAVLSATGAAPVSAQRPPTAGADSAPQNWLGYGKTPSEQRYSPLDQINTHNVSKLGLAWHFDFDEYRPVEATPLVVDGVMYVTSAWSKLYALDAATGAKLWEYDPKVPRAWLVNECCKAVNRGAAYWNGKVYVGTLDGRLVAVDAKTGAKVWETDTIVDRRWPYASTGAPRVVKGNVILGNSGADLGVRGYVSAYNAETGKMAWRFFIVPGDPSKGPDHAASDPVLAKAAKTWTGQWWTFGGGGTAWEAMAYDPELDLLYIGTGNGSPWNRKIRSPGGGDNLFLASILALRPSTGQYVWHYQVNPGESWDYTATQPIMLADLTIGGRVRKVLMQAPKNGFFYVIDRTTGKLISANNHVPVNWAKGIDLVTGRPIENPHARYPDGQSIVLQPGSTGGHGWYPWAYSPRTGLVYFASTINHEGYGDLAQFQFERGRMNFGTCLICKAAETPDPTMPVAKDATSLVAWDPVAQKAVWRIPRPVGRDGGVVATAGDLVFQGGGGDGATSAYDARSGEKLWSFDLQNPGIGGPISYAVNGEQYIAFAVGAGFIGQLDGPVPYPSRLPNNNRVVAFKLGAAGTLPAIDYRPQALPEPPADTGTAQQIAAGDRLFDRYCLICHGVQARGDRVQPDLRYSAAVRDARVWKSVLIDGALAGRGMVSFKTSLSEADAESLRLYVIRQAHIAQGQTPAQQVDRQPIQ